MKKLQHIMFAVAALLWGANAVFAAPATLEAKRVAVVLVVADDDDDDDQATVTTLYTTLMAAEKVAQMLNVELTLSESKVSDDVFVFSLKSQEQKDLAMKLIDEEGYEVGDNLFKVEKGANYRSINVANLPDGTYTFRIFNENGEEQSQEFTVERGKRVN